MINIYDASIGDKLELYSWNTLKKRASNSASFNFKKGRITPTTQPNGFTEKYLNDFQNADISAKVQIFVENLDLKNFLIFCSSI